MRYLIPGASIEDFPRSIPARLRKFGPWEARGQSGDLILTSAESSGAEYGEERKTPEGWTYWGPKETPHISALFRKNTIAEACNVVDLINGDRILIRPAYLEPHLVFTDGRIGESATDYGRRARRVMDLLRNKNDQGILHPESLALWAEAVGIVYCATPELIDDMHAFSLEDVDNIIAAVFSGPKQQPGEGSSPSPSPG